MLAGEDFDAVLLDIMLPGEDGIELCSHIRDRSATPVIFISCLSDDDTIVRAMGAGGDDYIVKPFRKPVLRAHIEANIRRARMAAPGEVNMRVGDLEFDTSTHSVRLRGEELSLSPTEYRLLCYMAQRKGRFVSFEELYTGVWERPSLGDYRALFVHIRNLRRKLGDDAFDPTYIRTHRRTGYIFYR